MSDPIATLTSQVRKITYILELKPDVLIQRWTKGPQHGEKRIAIRKLSPDLSTITSHPEHSTARLIGAILLLCSAVVIFFSIVQHHIPLLAPFIGTAGIWLLFVAIKLWRIETWTVIHERDGKIFAHVIHRGCDSIKREAFEKLYESTLIEEEKATHPQGNARPDSVTLTIGEKNETK